MAQCTGKSHRFQGDNERTGEISSLWRTTSSVQRVVLVSLVFSCLQVVGYHVVPMANLSLPTIQSRLCEGFRLRLQVPIDQFNHTLFLMRFSKYVKFNPQNIVIEPASGSGMEIRIYVQDSPTKTCEFIHNLVAVWDDTNLRNTVFGSAITQQVCLTRLVTV